MWIDRIILPELRKIATTFPVVVVTGPRQVGKTSLLERGFADYRYISLDVASLAEMAESRPEEFLQRHAPPLIIDEVQYAPALFRHIKARVDAASGEKGQFLLTGSQNFALMRDISDSLAGRAAVIPLLGLSAQEWRQSAAANGRPWRDFWLRGSFPGLWAVADISRERWYQGYLATYLERDVRNLLRVGNLRDFERFLRACAVRCGQMLNMADLGRDVGVAAATAREWLSVLQASNQIVLLEPYHRSLGKRLVKSPKLYFTDTGLAAFLLGLPADQPPPEHLAGALWENHVVGQWLRWRDWQNPAAQLWYWREAAGREVDLLIEFGGKLHAVECKYKERPDEADLRGIRRLRDFYNQPELPAFVACIGAASFELAENVRAVSGWMPWPLN